MNIYTEETEEGRVGKRRVMSYIWLNLIAYYSTYDAIKSSICRSVYKAGGNMNIYRKAREIETDRV